MLGGIKPVAALRDSSLGRATYRKHLYHPNIFSALSASDGAVTLVSRRVTFWVATSAGLAGTYWRKFPRFDPDCFHRPEAYRHQVRGQEADLPAFGKNDARFAVMRSGPIP
jgi:hypothetical protein